MIVIDACVAAKWYLNEQGSDEAARFLTIGAPLAAPALIRIEVLGAIIRHYREGRLSIQKAQVACGLWEADLAGGGLTLFADEAIIAEAATLAFTIRHTIQDCLYLAVAARTDARLVTADPKFHDRAAPIYKGIELLPGCRPS